MKEYKVTVKDDGTVEWRNLDGLMDREDGPALDGPREEVWFKNGQLHRVDGPAYVNKMRGLKEWYFNNRLHREDGPARVWYTGAEEYWVNGYKKSEQQFKQLAQCLTGSVVEIDGKYYTLTETVTKPDKVLFSYSVI